MGTSMRLTILAPSFTFSRFLSGLPKSDNCVVFRERASKTIQHPPGGNVELKIEFKIISPPHPVAFFREVGCSNMCSTTSKLGFSLRPSA